MRRSVCSILLVLMLVGSLLAVPGCVKSGISGLTSLINPDCLASGAISQEEYDDLPFWEQVLYTRNSCGLYEKGDLGDTISQWF